MTVPRFGALQAPGRREDARLVTGAGRYTGDVLVGATAALHAVFVRSDVAHGRLRAVETARALAMPGVAAVLRAKDVAAAGFGDIPCLIRPPGRGGVPPGPTPRPVLARDRVRFVGEAVALVVAATLPEALDAAEAVAVTADPLPAVSTLAEADAPEAPRLWDGLAGNEVTCFEVGDAGAAVAERIDRAAVRVGLELIVPRLVACPMEPRAALAAYDAETGRYRLEAPSQGAPMLREALAGPVLGVAGDRLRVVSRDVGGGFGARSDPYPEYAALLLAARRLGRPVRWQATRTESFLADHQARDGVLEGVLALDADGRFLALSARAALNLGAYASTFGHVVGRNIAACLGSVYDLPTIHVTVRSLVTNTAPTGPYRGAGRPEAAYLVERLVEAAARATGRCRIDLRRRNLIRPDAMPYRSAVGTLYDSGDFPALLDRAIETADWAGFPARREAARSRGRLAGIGLACFLETAGSAPEQEVSLRVAEDGRLEIGVPFHSSGQGHETVFAELVAARLGLAPEEVVLVQGDSDRVGSGPGAIGSRSLFMGGSAMVRGCEALVERGKALAAERFEAGPDDVEFKAGRFAVVGTDRSITLAELDRWARLEASADPTAGAGLVVTGRHVAPGPTFPNGCHVCEVEVDPETGAVAVTRFAAVDDCGTVLHPVLADGQVQGGIAQGLGAALLERCVHDGDGQILTASFTDYALPRAGDLPPFATAFHPVPSPTNPLGAKGIGEAGTTGAFAAAVNAVLDALSPLGVAAFDPPATPDRVWRALRAAMAGAEASGTETETRGAQ